MATSLYRVGSTANPRSQIGQELLDTLQQISDGAARLRQLRLALIQQKDGSAGNETDYVTPAAVFTFVAADGTLNEEVAEAAFAEIDSFVGNGFPSLEQCCARFKQ